MTGYVDTSIGRVTTTVEQHFVFSNGVVLQPSLIGDRQYIYSNQIIETNTTTLQPNGTYTKITIETYSIAISPLPTSIFQSLQRTERYWVNGTLSSNESFSDTIHAESPSTTTERYTYHNSSGYCYNHFLVGAQGYLSSDKLEPAC